jgi:GxxExxY protein
MSSRFAIPAQRQVPIQLEYKGIDLDCAYYIDILVDGVLLVELKAVDRLLPIHEAQVITYLRLAGIQTGLLINFHCASLRQGVRRLSPQPPNSP